MQRIALLALVVSLSLLALPAPSQAADDGLTKGLRYPSPSADGKHVVFSYRGDIWVAETKEKDPRITRLTIHEAQDTLPRFSPDGKHIVFASTRAGSYDLYVVSREGGEPRRLTFHSGTEITCDVSPDGKHVLFLSDRDATKRGLDAYVVPMGGGTAKRLTQEAGVREATFHKDGKHLVYVRGFNTIYQDNYEGSGNYDIWVQALTPKEGELPLPRRLTETRGNERYPFFSADGATVHFVAEEKGVANIYRMPAAGGARTQVTTFKGADCQRPDVGPGFRHMAFEREGQIWMLDTQAESPKPRKLPLKVRSDVRHSGIVQRTISSGTQQVDVSPDGRRLAFVVHGDIWTMDAGGGNAARVTSGPDIDEWPRWRPDGRAIAFQSNRKGNSDIWLVDANGQNVRPVTKHAKDDFFHDWSPDGQKLVFCSERSGNRDIWTIQIDTGEAVQLTKHSSADDDPAWSPDGRHIAFDSGREGNQAIYVMDASGQNVRRITSGGAFYQVPDWSPDGRFLIYEAFNPGSGQSGGLYVIGVNGGATMQLARSGQAACWSARGEHIYYTAGPNGRQEIFRVPAPRGVENRQKIPFRGTIQVDRKKELADLFEEAWVQLQRGFYDAKMHGVDWKAMKTKYKAMAVDAEIKDEFQNVIRQMLAELNASHLGIYGGTEPTHTVPTRSAPTGYLGADLADTPTKDGGRKVERVWPRGPLDKAGVRAGDVITRVGNTRLKPDTDLDRILAGTAGKDLKIRYKPFTQDGLGSERTTDSFKPLSANQIRAMTYATWVSSNARTVAKASKGRLGYIHLSQMNPANLQKFQRAVGQWIRNKKIKGMVLDVRDNGGGNIHQQLMQILTAKPFAYVRVRGAPRQVTQPGLYWDRPVVVLINERSFSDAEVFPHIFQELDRGQVIGVPTPGGVIGTNDITLSDGTRFRIPRVGFYGLDGTNLEGNGAKPDVVVALTAEDRRKGRDPQLQKAIEVLQGEVKAADAAAKANTSKPAPASTKPDTTPTKPDATPTTPNPNAPDRPDASATPEASAEAPLADAKAGEWVRYEVRMPGADEANKVVMKLLVDSVEDGTVFTSTEVEEGPDLQLPLPTEWPQGSLDQGLEALGGATRKATHTETLEGKEIQVVAAFVNFGGGSLEMHFTNAVPAWGLLRVKIGKHELMKATSWGIDEDAATPDEKPVDPAPAEPSAETPTPEEAPAKPDAAPEKPAPEKPAAENGAVPGPSADATNGTEADGAKEVPNPLHDAKEGEWVRMRARIGGQEAVVVQKVVKVADDEIHVKSSVTVGERTIEGDVQKMARRPHLRMRRGNKVEITEAQLEVAGKTLDCIVITRTLRNGQVEKRWISNDVPVRGLVRRERGGQVISELLAFGTE